jgi:hypothetical protein
MGVGHHTCHHLYRLASWQPEHRRAARRLSTGAGRGLPVEVEPVIAARVAAGESLRVLAPEYSVSYEMIRHRRHAKVAADQQAIA